jgi:hypothetical protein
MIGIASTNYGMVVIGTLEGANNNINLNPVLLSPKILSSNGDGGLKFGDLLGNPPWISIPGGVFWPVTDERIIDSYNKEIGNIVVVK